MTSEGVKFIRLVVVERERGREEKSCLKGKFNAKRQETCKPMLMFYSLISKSHEFQSNLLESCAYATLL